MQQFRAPGGLNNCEDWARFIHLNNSYSGIEVLFSARI